MLRGGNAHPPAFLQKLGEIKRWQHQRLTRTYADLAADPRYAPAVKFFLDELYGAGNTSDDTKPSQCALRDRDLIRMYPTIKRVLPTFAFETVKKALELDVLAEEFDQSLTVLLRGKTVNEANYVVAFREAGRRADRLRQVDLMREVGVALELVVKKPLIYSTLKMLRGPSKLAGMSAMQQFLEAGFTAFKHMKGADYFLETIATRETELIKRLFSAHPAPFDIFQ